MRLLVVTQTVDRNDPILGFFHAWIEDLAKHFEHIEVICLKEGQHALPANVSVHSLGKPSFAPPSPKATDGHGKASEGKGAHARSRIAYAVRFLKLAWKLRDSYDAVFVHMNQEYVLLAGLLWKVLGKRVYLWRNHHTGSVFTHFAGIFSRKVFYTSHRSYTARFANAVRMPVGIDAKIFKPVISVERIPHSILSLGRIAPQKHLEILIEALAALHGKQIPFSANIYGDALSEDVAYLANLKERTRERRMESNTRFFPGVPNKETPPIYSAHQVFVNTSAEGMYDKTMLEALACGCRVVASSPDFAEDFGRDFSFEEANAEDLSKKINAAFTALEVPAQSVKLAKHTLPVLIERLVQELST